MGANMNRLRPVRLLGRRAYSENIAWAHPGKPMSKTHRNDIAGFTDCGIRIPDGATYSSEFHDGVCKCQRCYPPGNEGFYRSKGFFRLGATSDER